MAVSREPEEEASPPARGPERLIVPEVEAARETEEGWEGQGEVVSPRLSAGEEALDILRLGIVLRWAPECA